MTIGLAAQRVDDFTRIPGYNRDTALRVLESLEGALRRDEVRLHESKGVSAVTAEYSMALYFLLTRGEPEDELRALKAISNVNCLSIGMGLRERVRDLIPSSPAKLQVAALNAFEWQNRDSERSMIDAFEIFEARLQWMAVVDWFSQKMARSSWVECRPNVVEQFVNYVRGKRVFARGSIVESDIVPTPQRMMLWALADSRATYRNPEILKHLRVILRNALAGEERYYGTAMLAKAALASHDSETAEDKVALPHLASEWGNATEQAAVIEGIGRLGLRKYLPSVLTAHLGGKPIVELSTAAAMIRFNQDAEDWGDLLLRGLGRDERDPIRIMAARYAGGVRFDLEQKGERISREQAYVLKKLVKTLV